MADKIVRYGFWVIIGAFGLILALRMLLGPFSIGIRVDSPMNVEAVLGLALVLALVARTVSMAGREEAHPAPLTGRVWLGALPLLLLTALAFWHSLHFFFLSDDFVLLKAGNSASPADFRALFSIDRGYGFYRPIARLSLALDSTWAKYDTVAWHASNLILHYANSFLVFLLALRLCTSRFAAFFAAALFSIHGTRPEAVVWIAGRFDLLATFFALSGLILFMRSLQESTSRGRLFRMLSLACMVLAILSKESAYIFPLLLVLILILRRDSLLRRISLCAPFFVVAAALFVHRLTFFGGIGGYRDVQSGQARALTFSLLRALKALLSRLWAVLFFPVNWSIQPGALLAVLTACGIFSLGWLATGRIDRRRMTFSLGFVLVSALPPLHMLLIGADLEKSRLVYLASVGFCLMLALAVERLEGRAYWIAPALILIFNLFALEHNLRAWEYASERAQSACAAAVDCARQPARKMVVAGIPEILRGVYFFGNGFPECVELRRGDPSLRIELRHGDASSSEGEGVRLMNWDSSADMLRCVEPR